MCNSAVVGFGSEGRTNANHEKAVNSGVAVFIYLYATSHVFA